MAIYADKKGGKLTGRFRVEVQFGGRRLRGRFNTMADAEAREREWKRQLTSGDTSGATERFDLRSGPKTLRQLLEKAAPLLWNGSNHGEHQEARIEQLIEWLGDPKLGSFSVTFIDDAVLRLRAEGRSPATINRCLTGLNMVLKWGAAKGRGYVADVPEMPWQDEDEGRIRYLSAAEEAKLVELLTGFGRRDIANFVLAAIDTGCRRTELLTAQRDQLDGNWLRLWGEQTKTGYSRSVPLTPLARLILDERLPWSFTDVQLRYWFNKAKAAMGLAEDEEFVVHALRHTCATRLVERGVNLRVVQKFMGHRSINTTLRYAHVSDDLLASAAEALVAPKLARVGAQEVGDDPRLALVHATRSILESTGAQV